MDTKAIVKKAGAFSLGPIIGAVVNFFTTPLITYFISSEEYGKASMFTVALSILQIVVFLGMDQAYSKRYYESEDKASLFISALAPSAILVVLIEIAILFLRKWVGWWIFDSNEEWICVFALMAILPALAIEKFALLSIRMSQRGKLYSAMSIFSKLMILACTVLFFLSYEKSFRSVVLGETVAQIIYATVLCIIQRNHITIRIAAIDGNEVRKLLKFGLPLVPTTIIGWILTGTDKVMLRTMCEYDQLGLYTVAAKVAAVLTIVQSCFTIFWVPLAHQWNNDGSNDNERFVKVGRLIACIMSLGFVGILLFKDIIFLIFSAGYQTASKILPFLLFTPIMYTISEVTVMGIYFKEKTSWTILISIISASVNIVMNLVLIPIYGPQGAAIATGISYITFFWARTLISRSLWFKFSLRPYILITALLLIAAIVSTFLQGLMVYIICLVCIALLVVYFRGELRRAIGIVINITKDLIRRRA